MQEILKRFWVEKFECFSIYGSDAKKFLNGITTANIINSDSKVCKTCWLTPNGILKALFEINYLENKLDLIILEGNTSEVGDYLNKIIFPSDDVSISDPFLINRLQEVDEINSWRISQPIFFNNDSKEYEIYENKKNLLNFNELKLWKINQAIPSLGNEINGKTNPLELGLTDCIDFKKGCFLGQETMSKIRNVSSLKQEIRVWTSLDYKSDINFENNKIYLDSFKKKSVGIMTSFYKFNKHIKGLAMIKRQYLEIGNYFYSEIFGQIKISKSVGSIFI